jgi:hypothetical protein
VHAAAAIATATASANQTIARPSVHRVAIIIIIIIVVVVTVYHTASAADDRPTPYGCCSKGRAQQTPG